MLSDFGVTFLDFQLSRALTYCGVLRLGGIARMSAVHELRVLKIWGCLRVWSFELSIVSIALGRTGNLTLRTGFEGLGLKFRSACTQEPPFAVRSSKFFATASC